MGCSAAALLVPGGAGAQQQAQQVDVYQAPSIAGAAQVGATLTAHGGAWRGPSGTQAKYAWWRCPSPSATVGCREVSDATTQYTLVNADQGRYILLMLYAWFGAESDYMLSAPTAQVGPAATLTPTPSPTATPGPTPPPSATATPTPTPPAPTATPPPPAPVATAAATPVPTVAPAQSSSGKRPKTLRPFPVVRMRGRLSVDGARVTLLSVQAPRHVRIAVTCAGKGCPTKRWRRTAAHRVTRIGAFERDLVSGMRITVVVSRRGYLGKRTVFWIRRGRPPLRADSCLSPAGRTTRCPAVAR